MRYSILILWLIIPSAVYAQELDTLNYYPLEPGNAWTYFYVLEPPFMPPDTVWGGTFSTTDQISISDTLYSLAHHPFSLATTLRYDGEGKVWARVKGRDVLYWDFTLVEGESYVFVEEDGTEYDVSLERWDIIDVGGGRFYDLIQLNFKWTGVDNDHSYIFAKGVGIVSASGEGGAYLELFAAEVGGRVITSIMEIKDVVTLSATVYPNPSSETLYVEMSGVDSDVLIRLVDVLGREMRAYRNDYCYGSCKFELQRNKMAPGVYFLVIETGGNRMIRKLIYSK